MIPRLNVDSAVVQATPISPCRSTDWHQFFSRPSTGNIQRWQPWRGQTTAIAHALSVAIRTCTVLLFTHPLGPVNWVSSRMSNNAPPQYLLPART